MTLVNLFYEDLIVLYESQYFALIKKISNIYKYIDIYLTDFWGVLSNLINLYTSL